MSHPAVGNLAGERGRHMGLTDDIVEGLRPILAIESLILQDIHTVQSPAD
jgi:hypothetical protein